MIDLNDKVYCKKLDKYGIVVGIVSSRYFLDCLNVFSEGNAENMHYAWGNKYYQWETKPVYFVRLSIKDLEKDEISEMYPEEEDFSIDKIDISVQNRIMENLENSQNSTTPKFMVDFTYIPFPHDAIEKV